VVFDTIIFESYKKKRYLVISIEFFREI